MDVNFYKSFDVWFRQKVFFGVLGATLGVVSILYFVSTGAFVASLLTWLFVLFVWVIIDMFVMDFGAAGSSILEPLFSKARPEVVNILNMVGSGLAEFEDGGFVLKGADGNIVINASYIYFFYKEEDRESVTIDLTDKEAYIAKRYLSRIKEHNKKNKHASGMSTIEAASMSILKTKEKDILSKIEKLKAGFSAAEASKVEAKERIGQHG